MVKNLAWLENGELISDTKSKVLISQGFQFVEGVLKSPDEVNSLIRSGYTRTHLSEKLKYNFTTKEIDLFRILGDKALPIGIFSLGLWGIGKFIKKNK